VLILLAGRKSFSPAAVEIIAGILTHDISIKPTTY